MSEDKAINYKNFISILLLLIYLLLCMLKAVMGILGSSEALVASSLYTLFSSFMVLKLIFADQCNTALQKSFRLASLIIGAILVFGIFDVLVFSIIRLVRASQGLLVEPSMIAVVIALFVILVNGYFYIWILKLENEKGKSIKTEVLSGKPFAEKSFEEIVGSKIGEFKDILIMSIIVPIIVIIGCFGARLISIYFDAIAALCIIIIIIIPRVIVMLKDSVRDCFSSEKKYTPVRAGA